MEREVYSRLVLYICSELYRGFRGISFQQTFGAGACNMARLRVAGCQRGCLRRSGHLVSVRLYRRPGPVALGCESRCNASTAK
jgi:hypothetical protein